MRHITSVKLVAGISLPRITSTEIKKKKIQSLVNIFVYTLQTCGHLYLTISVI